MVGDISRVWDRIPTWMLYGVLVIVWAPLFGDSVEGAILQFLDPASVYASTVPRSEQLRSLRQTAGVIVCGLLIVGVTAFALARFGNPLPPRTGRAIDAAGAWGAGHVLATIVGLLLASLAPVLPWMDVSDQTKADVAEYESPALFMVKALAAGLAEEPLLAALPVLLLCGRLPIAAIVALGGAIRGLLHVYYGGYGFVWAFIWGGCAVWIYYRYRRLWLLVLLHGFVLNLQAIALVDTVPEWIAAGTLLVSSLGAFVLALIWLGRNWSRLTLRVTEAKQKVRNRLGSTRADDGHENSVDPRPGGGGRGSEWSLRKGDRTQAGSVSQISARRSD